MAFQDFISSKAFEKVALEAALARVIAELHAANTAAPAVDSVVSKIQELMLLLQTSPSAVVSAAKEAIRESCGDISMLVAQPREVSTLVIPQFVTVSPVLTDIIGGTDIDNSATVEVTNTTSTNEILLDPHTPETNSTNDPAEGTNKTKRRTQAGFDRKVEEWGKILDNLNASNHKSGLAQIEDEYRFWINGTKFMSEEIVKKFQGAVAYWSSQENIKESEETTEVYTPETTIVVAPVTATEDLSSFNVEETQTDVAITGSLDPVIADTIEAPTQHDTQLFLDKLKVNNLSESGLGDLQEEIIRFYGGKDHTPQELEESLVLAWRKLNSEDGSNADFVVEDNPYEHIPELGDILGRDDDQENMTTHEPLQIEESFTPKDEVVLDKVVLRASITDDGIYDSYIPENEELAKIDILTASRQDQILRNNREWQDSILNNCETLGQLAEWDGFIALAIEKDNESITPETLEALDTVRERLESRGAEQINTINPEILTNQWLDSAKLASNLEDIQIIYDEIKESGIQPSMDLIRDLRIAKTRLTKVEKPVETDPKPIITDEEQIARESILPQWSQTPTSTPAKSKNPFAGRKTTVQKIVVEEVTTDGNHSDYVTISNINTSGIFNFRTLDGKTEQHNRFNDRYILEPGIKLYEPTTGFVFEVITWEEVKDLNPLIGVDTNKLSLKSLHSPTRSYSKTTDKTDFVVVSDQMAKDLIATYRARLSQMDAEAATPMQVGS